MLIEMFLAAGKRLWSEQVWDLLRRVADGMLDQVRQEEQEALGRKLWPELRLGAREDPPARQSRLVA